MEIGYIDKLHKFLGNRFINCVRSKEEITKIIDSKGICLPDDFLSFYQKSDGMSEEDNKGFRFYSLIDLKTFSVNKSTEIINENLILFGDYMHESWWYGVKMSNRLHYQIGITPDLESFHPICVSIEAFFSMYLEDSDRLYEF